jgi:hypothetical protein
VEVAHTLNYKNLESICSQNSHDNRIQNILRNVTLTKPTLNFPREF